MEQEDLKIHGSIILLLKKFIEHTYDSDTWLRLTKDIGSSQVPYEMHENYPVSHLFSTINAVAQHTGRTGNELIESFGEYLVPDLIARYKSYINPTWKTFEMLENTELVMHKAVRREEHQASPPFLNVSTVHDRLIIIDYYSKRRLASLAVGIVKGIAKYYNESQNVHIVPTTNPDDERVQIRIEFS